MVRTHAEIISLWPSFSELADDVGQATEAVRLWQKRNRIPSRHWMSVVVAAKKRRFGVTADELALGMLKVNGK